MSKFSTNGEISFRDARSLLIDAAAECLAPDQFDEFQSLFYTDDDAWVRLLRCIEKRLTEQRAA